MPVYSLDDLEKNRCLLKMEYTKIIYLLVNIHKPLRDHPNNIGPKVIRSEFTSSLGRDE